MKPFAACWHKMSSTVGIQSSTGIGFAEGQRFFYSENKQTSCLMRLVQIPFMYVQMMIHTDADFKPKPSRRRRKIEGVKSLTASRTGRKGRTGTGTSTDKEDVSFECLFKRAGGKRSIIKRRKLK